MTPTCFDLHRDGPVAHLVLNRPDSLNSMVRAFWNELPEIVDELSAEGSVRCLVLSSTGRHFSAGMDLSVFTSGEGVAPAAADRATAAEKFRLDVRRLQHSFSCLEQARFPVVAAVQGGVIGGAVDLTSACDIRYATADAFFQIQEINIGMTADVGTFPRLCRLLPEGMVRELAYTGRRFSADEALRTGLVNAVFPDADSCTAHALEVARQIATKPPVAVTGSKVMIGYARDHSTADALDYVGVWNAAMLSPEHMGEAISARAQKRTPVFPDLAPLRGRF